MISRRIRRESRNRRRLLELYSRLTWIAAVTYSLYAIVWLFSQGFPSFSVTLEVVACSLLDIINKANPSETLCRYSDVSGCCVSRGITTATCTHV